MPDRLLKLLDRRVLVLDGAMGTNIHLRNLAPEDFGGRDGCNEVLVDTRPDVIREIHASFFEVGCDAVETNTFGSNRIVLAEYDLADRAWELSRRAAQLARGVADEFSSPERPRFVFGSVGPGTKLPTLGQITFDQIHQACQEQVSGLLEGGVDCVLLETCQDMLQVKAAVIAARDAMHAVGRSVPLFVQVTIETTGTMLLGTEISAAVTTLEALPVDGIGLNCATGPKEMIEHLRYLSQTTTRKISCVPNAGLPENEGGIAVYRLGPDELAEWLEKFVDEFGVNLVGGCCGTTPEHLAKVVQRLSGRPPAPREPQSVASVSSLYSTVTLRQEPAPLLAGERTNANGSRKYKRLLEQEDWNALVEMAREQEREGAHVLDVCDAYVGRDEARDMRETLSRFNQHVTIPLMIDSTETPVIEASLKLISGKPIINSINLEDGRKRVDQVVPLARRFGAALVALTIDEEGQAYTADRKFAIARRIYDLCVNEYAVPPGDLLFDALTFTLGTGRDEYRRVGIETLEAIRRIKAELPGCHTILGVSNISFGLAPALRQVLNSVFLHYAIEAGLDSAIVHASKIIPLFKIDEVGRELARRLIFDERTDASDPLIELMAHYEGDDGRGPARSEEAKPAVTVEERLKQAIIDGRRQGLIADLDLARQRYEPLEIINEVLLDGMKVVGDLFGSGQMQLPFVLQSAEVMKAAVAHLEPFMEKVENSTKGTIVLATVKGDVHDIGKNLVDIILTNNGYTVHNLGIKVPINTIIETADARGADALGMSGLLVKSTLVMKENLEELNALGISIPVLCGGAALTRKYVEHDLRSLYRGPVFYGQDAFAGLRIMDALCGGRLEELLESPSSTGRSPLPRPSEGRADVAIAADRVPADRSAPVGVAVVEGPEPAAFAAAVDDATIPDPPYFGARVVLDIALDEVFRFLNERALIGTQWQFRKNKVRPAEYERLMRETAHPLLERMKQTCVEEKLLEPRVVYGFFRCQRDGDDLVILEDDGRSERTRFRFPRQRGREGLCLSDYFASRESGRLDVVALQCVTVGSRVSQRCAELFAGNHYTEYLYLHGMGVEATEALAELWHQRVRQEWGIGGEDADDVQKLFHLHYRGCRYSFGYPACPNLEDQAKLVELLDAERIGVRLTESFQLEPEQSTSALITHHPQAKYFNVE
jgi:5-methyltetrahydrofolate--homocysteine methyltransferase